MSVHRVRDGCARVTVTLSTRPDYPTVRLACVDYDTDREAVYELDRTPDGTDFAAVWADGWLSYDCSVDDWVQATTELEEAAYETAHYDGLDVATLYEMCAAVDATDTVLEMDGISEGQFQELTGMMLLCPDHRLAKRYVSVLKDFASGITIDNREQRAFDDLPKNVVSLFDGRTATAIRTCSISACRDYEPSLHRFFVRHQGNDGASRSLPVGRMPLTGRSGAAERSYEPGTVAVVGDFGVTVRLGSALIIQADEDDSVDREDALFCDDIAHFGAHGQ